MRRTTRTRLSSPMIDAVLPGTSMPARTYEPAVSLPCESTRTELVPVSSLENVPSCVPGRRGQHGCPGRGGEVAGVDVEAHDAGRGRRAAGAVVDDGAQRDRGASCGEPAVEALGELRAVVGGLCGEGQREHRDGAEAGGAAEALVEILRHDVPPCRSVGGTFSSQEYHRAGRELGGEDRFVYGHLTPAADPSPIPNVSARHIEGWNSGTSGSQPARSTATSEGGVITVAAPSRGRATRSA